MSVTEDERRQAQEDGYVECSECGHPLEHHMPTCGSDGCTCAVRWSRTAVERYRRRLGLPGRWKPGTI